MTVAEGKLRRGALCVQLEQSWPMPLNGEFSCEAGELLALVGPSGTGKTSMLRCLAGLMTPELGKVEVGEKIWLDTDRGVCLPPQQRHVGMVFQNYALMPHLNALDNVALALLHLPMTERRERASQWLEHVRLSRDQFARRPAQLSGGQQQRVAVARALAREPKLLLLDEPFSAVDQMNRQGLYDLLADLRRELNIPIVLVTHDLVEARHLADSIVVMDNGKVLQQGKPEQIYRSPRNARVADIVGIQNRFQGVWRGPRNAKDQTDNAGWLEWADGNGQPSGVLMRVRDKGRLSVGQPLTWVIHGDGLHLRHEEGNDDSQSGFGDVELMTTVVSRKVLGDITIAQCKVEELFGVSLCLFRSGPQRRILSDGETLSVRVQTEWVHVMPTRAAQD